MTENGLRLRSVKIDRLVADPQNVRKHNGQNMEAIRRSLETFGQRKPIVVAPANDGRLVVIAGNGTLEAAIALGWKEITVTDVPADWDAEKARAYGIADNRTAELAEWDQLALADALVELDSVGWDIANLGFETLDPTATPDTADALPGVSEDKYREQYGVIVICTDEVHQEQVYNQLKAEGHQVRVVTT